MNVVFFTLFATIFCVTLGVGLVIPLIPVYARELGASGFLIGLIFGSFSISRTLLLPVFGTLSDRYGRKPFLVTGLFIYFVMSILFAVTRDVTLFVLIRMGQGAGSAMILPVAQAYIGDLTPRNREGRNMGLFNVSLFGGLATGPLLGGWVKDAFGIHTSFYSMAGFALLGCLLCLFFLPRESAQPIRKRRFPTPYRRLMRNRTIAGLTAFRLTFTTSVGIVWAFLPLWANMRAGLESTRIGMIVSLNVAMGGILMAPMGMLADRVSRRGLIAVGGILAIASMLWLSAADDFWSLFAANGLFGVASGVSFPAIMAVAVREGRISGSMGSLMGILATAHSAGMLFGSLLSGFLIDRIPFERAFQAGAAILVLGTISLLAWTSRHDTPPSDQG